MNTVKNALFIAFALLFIGCGEHHDHAHKKDAMGDTDGAYGLELNGSEKWQMDAHTRSMFQKMSARLDSIDIQEASKEELQKTSLLLQQDLDSLIAGCTMQGAAHDQLHVYLTAYIPAVKKMSEKGSRETLLKVKELIGIYPLYFR